MTVGEGIRLGMIGCGAIAESFHLPALERIPGVAENMVLADPNPARLSALGEKFSSAACVQDYRELEGKVDGVIVATPPASHFEICKWFLERGIDVLCEKPLTEALDEANELVRIADHHGSQLAVNQTRRFFPTYRKIRELLEAGILGELQSIIYHDGVEFDWPAASPFHFATGAKGTWSDTGVHLLDTICYWLDATPQLVESLNDSQGGPEALATVRLLHQKCEIEIKVSRLGRLMNGFKIVGSEGSIESSAAEFAEVQVRSRSGGVKIHKCGSRKLSYEDLAQPLLENFVSVVAHGEKPVVTGESTLGTIGLLERAYDQNQRYHMPWNDRTGELRRDAEINADTEPMRVLVTGASGFVGGRVVEMLQESRIAEPIATIRNWSRAARIARRPSEIVICDIGDPAQVDSAVQGVDAIVHCAKTDDRESIVGGTRNMLEAAVKHGIERFVFLSTAEVYGQSVHGRISETHPTAPTGRIYSDAKIEAEQVCREFHARGLMPTILRPSLIYGPFSSSWSINVAKRLRSGRWGLFEEHGEGNANLVYIDDLVQAIVRALNTHKARGESFNVNGPTVPTWNAYFEQLNAAIGLSPLRRIPANKSRFRTRVMDTLDFVADRIVDRFEDQLMEIYLRGGWPTRVMKWIKGELNSTPSGSELNDLFARDVIYADDKARDLLGYQPKFELADGITASAAWLSLHEYATNSSPDRGEVVEPGDESLVTDIQEFVS